MIPLILIFSAIIGAISVILQVHEARKIARHRDQLYRVIAARKEVRS